MNLNQDITALREELQTMGSCVRELLRERKQLQGEVRELKTNHIGRGRKVQQEVGHLADLYETLTTSERKPHRSSLKKLMILMLLEEL
jgi:uncharacterized coiled-coil DUF342 family protein